MILQNGVTGFYKSIDNKENYICSQRFKQLCYEIAYHNHGEIQMMDSGKTGKNFYFSKMRFGMKNCYILLNVSYPYVAFASVVDMGTITFIDKPDYIGYLASEYFVLNLEELNMAYPNKHIINQLNTMEQKQISYWKPATVGEIIFNFWD